MNDDVKLTPGELDILREELRALGEKGPRTDPRAGGCLVAFTGMVLLVLTPAVGAWVPIPGGAGLALFVLAVALLLGGAVMGILGAGSRSRGVSAAREAELVTLTAWEAGNVSRDAALRAAVRYLVLDREAGGPMGGTGPGAAGALDDHGRAAALLAAVSAVLGPGSRAG